MTGARLLAPLALALGCTHQTELLAFCPTSIDVFGGANTQLVGCGGRAMPPDPVEIGYFDPGAQEYDSTLAGRLQARLVADPDLVPLFGSAWKVRSCASPEGQLSAVTPPIAQDSCGPDDSPPAMGSLTSICTDQPAPVVLLVADAVDDGCHGGFADPRHMMKMPDEATYTAHLAMRLDAFLGARAPRKLIVGPATEWRAARRPARMGAGSPMYEPEACTWQRPDWDEHGMAQWQSVHAGMAKLLVVSDLHDEFKRYHPCCETLGGVNCETSWFVAGQMDAPAGPDLVNCDGAGTIVDFWYAALKQYLVAGQFYCP